MTVIKRIRTAKIKIVGREHFPIHCHVDDIEVKAVVDLVTFDITAGSIPANMKKEIMDWIKDNRTMLIEQWNLHNPSLPYKE
jgi:hypothetical protein